MSKAVGIVLAVYRGDALAGRYRIVGRTFKIGRMSFCEVVLDDSSVSLTHAYGDIRQDGAVFLRTTGSGSEVLVNGEAITNHVIEPTDDVRIGPFRLILEAVDQGDGVSLAAPSCPSCSFQNPPGSRFCNQCGTALKAS